MVILPVGLNTKDPDQMEKFSSVLRRLNESPDFSVFIEVLCASRDKYKEELAALDTAIPDNEYAPLAKNLANKFQVYDEVARFVGDFVALNEIGEADKERLDNLDPYQKVTHNEIK